MITAIIGNDSVAIGEYLQQHQDAEHYDAVDDQPEVVTQPTLFSTARILSNYTKWSPAQRKRFIKLDNDTIDIFVQVAKVGAKDPLAQCPMHTFQLPANRQAWSPWIKSRAKTHGLTINNDDIQVIIQSIGEDPWAIDTELARWSLVQQPLKPVTLTDHTAWNWIDMVIAGDMNASEELQSLSHHAVFMLIGALGQRLYTQTLMFRGLNPEPLKISPYVWGKARQSRQYGWDLGTSIQWLSSLKDVETRCKGQGSRLEPWALLIQWHQQLMLNHPHLSQ